MPLHILVKEDWQTKHGPPGFTPLLQAQRQFELAFPDNVGFTLTDFLVGIGNNEPEGSKRVRTRISSPFHELENAVVVQCGPPEASDNFDAMVQVVRDVADGFVAQMQTNAKQFAAES